MYTSYWFHNPRKWNQLQTIILAWWIWHCELTMGPARFVSIYIGFYYISRCHIFMCLICQLYRYQFMYSIFTLHSTFIQLGGPRAQEGVNGHNVTHPRPTLRASSRLTVILLVSFELYTSSSYILLSILCIRSRESRVLDPDYPSAEGQQSRGSRVAGRILIGIVVSGVFNAAKLLQKRMDTRL